MDEEAEYKKRYEALNRKLSDPKVSNKVDDLLEKISKLVDCDVELNFMVTPHLDNYQDVQESDEYIIPEQTTMKLDDFIGHLNKEKDGDFDVYFDPIYLKNGVNEIIDILITTLDKKMIIVPISNNKKIKL